MDEQKRPRAWVYARIPGDYVGTMDSIKVCALQAHADGCTVVGSSTDEHGGWLLRPGYREMLRHIRKGEIDTVYICRMRHISRSEGHLISFFRQLTSIFPKFSARKPNAPKAKALAKAAGAAAATACKRRAVNCVCPMKSAVCVTMNVYC